MVAVVVVEEEEEEAYLSQSLIGSSWVMGMAVTEATFRL